MSLRKSLPVHKSVVNARSQATTFTHQARSWNGTLAVMTEVHVDGPLSMSVCIPDRAQLGVMLEQVGGICEPRLHSGRPRKTKVGVHEINFAPPGVRTWGESDKIRSCRSISLLFDPATLARQMHEDTRFQLPQEPWLGLSCEPIARLARLLASEFQSQDELSGLYADSLIVAISVQLRRRFTEPERSAPEAAGLSHAELKRVLEFIEDNIAEQIRLQDLVALTDMSQSTFCAAFKLSTGVPPHRYHLSARIRRAQATLLAKPTLSLADVALELGFADQAHFGRVFRNLVGVTPGTWLSSSRGRNT